MRPFLIFLILLNFLHASQRPKIALVLSGGGARGGAHVGVLKVLEAKKIPIDFIVGTSMGAFIGGLYASGKTPKQIETMLIETKWKDFVRTDFVRKDTTMREKEREYYYQGKLKAGVNVNNEIVLPSGVFNRQPMLQKYQKETQDVAQITNFDNLFIPFRSVATNIKNGKAVVLSSGSLARAIYASTAVPGGFQPINIDGVDLVDGGISQNIPIEIAQQMGADVVIAVDVSEDFDEDMDVNSYFTVVGQLMNILMRKNANESIAHLREQDILLTPNLDGFSGLDTDKYISIIQAGEDVAQKEYDKKLKKLSLSKEEYLAYLDYQKLHVEHKEIIIDKIVIKNPTYVNSEMISSRLSIKEGEVFDGEVLRKDILDIYNLGLFDEINYNIVEKDNKNILELSTAPSWDNHGEINFSLGIEDDFSGHSTYSLKAGYTMFGLNSYGGEWRSDVEIGRNKRLYTEYFQPLTPTQRFYFKSALLYNDRNEYVPATSADIPLPGNLDIDMERYGGNVGLGTYLFDNVELELGVAGYKDNIEAKLTQVQANYDSRQIYSSLRVDTLDNLNFPNTGWGVRGKWIQESQELGSDYDFQQIYFSVEKPFTFGNHNITTYIKYGETYNQDGKTSLIDGFTLGGLFNLSGFAPYSLNDDNLFLGVIKYRYRLREAGFFGTLGTPLYAGFSAEVGNAWDYRENINFQEMYKSGTIYIAADTLFGPFYLAYGHSDDSQSAFYLYLGEKF